MSASTQTAALPRLIAARLVHAVVDKGESLSTLLTPGLKAIDDPRQRALAQELGFGTLRWYFRLQAVAAQLISKPLKKKDRDVEALIMVGLYQLLILDTPAHAAVSETVQAARSMGKNWAAGLVNAVLRNAVRRSKDLLVAADRQPAGRWAHPDWWVRRLEQDWPNHWQSILEAGNQRPPMVLRVNALQGDRDDYLRRLDEAGIEAHVMPLVGQAVSLQKPVSVDALPGFRDGALSVQDAAAQLSAGLLDIQSGQRVLDACAAPGGKTGHLLEAGVQADKLVAIDSNASRMEKVIDNLQRLKLNAELVVADAADVESWWDGQPFDRILLDAPCSASGVVRRHPDIKLLRCENDIDALALEQQRLLGALWPLLASGGILLYVTCSVFRQENSDSVQLFLRDNPDASESMPEVGWGHPQVVGRQLLPGEQGTDGFYYARLVKA
jgi:16S rRNA (cytosine967-C5)-methyltransferase